jgi:hypothetical protein
MKRSESYLDFWLGSLSVAAFLAGTWANGVLLEIIP